MVTNRFNAWDALGEDISSATCVDDAIQMANLDWKVLQAPVLEGLTGSVIPKCYANIRDVDNTCLGIVTGKYQIVQNDEAFDFVDNLIPRGAEFIRAGMFRAGRAIWLLVKLPSFNILGDAVDNYLVFINSHDGCGSIKCCLTPTRVACSNTLNLALSTAYRRWSSTHVGNLQQKLAQADEVFQLSQNYAVALQEEANKLAMSHLSQSEVNSLIEKTFPTAPNLTRRQLDNIYESRSLFINEFYNSTDLQNYKGTKWAYLNAVADYVDHVTPKRNTSTYTLSNWNRIVQGHSVLDATYELLSA